MTERKLRTALKAIANPEIAEHSQRFFKTGEGEYGSGDVFLGIRVPNLRKLAKEYKHLPLNEVKRALHSRFHEERLCSLFILVGKYEKGDVKLKEQVFSLYLENTAYVNNWDLVDGSAHQIVGGHLYSRDRDLLYSLAKSDNMWERRIAMIATYHFIKKDDFGDTLELAELLLADEEDLIHKAVGWMLREVGNRNPDLERAFLARHYKAMPRTMLRYAIEKFPEPERKRYLRSEI